jgi:spoIIIJ-associated protein
MRYEARTIEEAVEGAARALGKTAAELKYTVIRDEKSFWGGRVVEIEVEEGGVGGARRRQPTAEDDEPTQVPGFAPEKEAPLPVEVFEPAPPPRPAPAGGRERERENIPGATDAEAVALVESTLTELLSAAGLLVEIRRRESSGDELLFELIGDDVEPLLANKGEGLTGLEVLAGRIAAKRLGKPVHPRLDADGFRAHRKDALEELARQSADEVRRSRRPSLLPPLAPWERRLVHLALADDAELETESEGDGFMKRVEVRLKR